MIPGRVLVAFASRTGSTAAIAETIAAALRGAGLDVDCRPASGVEDLSPYDAVVLGSGVFSTRHLSDGGGFLTRHAAALHRLPLWLFTSGPIGSVHALSANGGPEVPDEPPAVAIVARAVSARGSATFGAARPGLGGSAPVLGGRADTERIRGWAIGIAADLARPEHSFATG